MHTHIYRAAWEHHVANPDPSTKAEDSPFFLAYLLSQQKPQTYRYLRAVVGPTDSSYLDLFEKLDTRLKQLARLGLDHKSVGPDLLTLANQARDLETAFEAFKKELKRERKGEVPDREGHPGNPPVQSKPRVRRGRAARSEDGQADPSAS